MKKVVLLAVITLALLSFVTSSFAGSLVYRGNFEDDFEGLEEGNVYETSDGRAWLQISSEYQYAYGYRPEVIIVKEGNSFLLCTKAIPNTVVQVVPLQKKHIAGESKGWEGETIFKLTDGTIWQQAEYYYNYNYRYGRGIYIYKKYGAHFAVMEGINKAVRVKRLH